MKFTQISTSVRRLQTTVYHRSSMIRQFNRDNGKSITSSASSIDQRSFAASGNVVTLHDYIQSKEYSFLKKYFQFIRVDQENMDLHWRLIHRRNRRFPDTNDLVYALWILVTLWFPFHDNMPLVRSFAGGWLNPFRCRTARGRLCLDCSRIPWMPVLLMLAAFHKLSWF